MDADLSVNVFIDEEGEAYLRVAPNSEIFESTSLFLQWRQAENYVETRIHLAIMHLLQRATFTSAAEERAQLDAASPITFNLNRTAWSRILDDLTASGLFSSTFADEHAFSSALLAAPIQENLHIICPDDLQLADALADVEGTSAPRGRGKGRQATATPAEQPTPRPGQLKFLSLAPVCDFISDRGPPLGPLLRLIGSLGPCHGEASRSSETSTVRVVAAILIQGINSSFELGGSSAEFDHPVLAAYLPEFISATELPWLLKSRGSSPSTLIKELSDGIRCSQYAHTSQSIRMREPPPFFFPTTSSA